MREALFLLQIKGHWEVDVVSLKVDFLLIGLILLDLHDLLDCFLDVELGDSLAEVARLYLGHVEDVLHLEPEQLRGVVLDQVALVHLLEDLGRHDPGLGVHHYLVLLDLLL